MNGQCSRRAVADVRTESADRIDPIASDDDWYEPCEPALEQDGLPWFYFIPSVDKLHSQFHEQYIRESGELWGDDQKGT